MFTVLSRYVTFVEAVNYRLASGSRVVLEFTRRIKAPRFLILLWIQSDVRFTFF